MQPFTIPLRNSIEVVLEALASNIPLEAAAVAEPIAAAISVIAVAAVVVATP